MKHIAAFALLVLGGNEHPSGADVEKLLKDSGVNADKEKIEKMIAAFDGKNFHEMVKGGLEKMASMGGGAPAAAAGGDAPKEEVKKEEKPEEIEEVDMGNFFGGDDDDY